MPNNEIIALEKKLEKLRSEPDSSKLVVTLNEIALACFHSDTRKAEACALEAMDLADRLGLPAEHAKSCRTLGIINRNVEKFVEAMLYCRKAMDIYEKLEDKEGMASVQTSMALTYSAQGMIDKTLEHHHESLRLKQEYGANEDELANCYFNLGACYSTLHRMEQAQSFYETARKIWEESGNRKRLAYLYNNIGCLCGDKKELDRALEYFKMALDIREDLGDKKGIASTLANLGQLHEQLGNNESAQDFLVRSCELFEEIGNRRGVAYTCGYVGNVYIKLGRLDQAEEVITRGLEITRKFKIKDWEILCLQKITDLYEAKGDLQKALQHSRELNTCVEEHLNEKSMEKIAGLQVQFETEKKEKEAEIFRLKNIELSEMNDELREALAHVKRLQGMLPICANCKKVRDDEGYWQQIESYISEHSDAKITHGICPECVIKLYGKDFIVQQ